MHIQSSESLMKRRTLLRGIGVTLGLPLLEAMLPAHAAEMKAATPESFIGIQTNMGILPQYFFPKTAGRQYESTPYLDILKAHRDQMTVFSGVSHPEVDGGHQAEISFLTAAPHPGRGGFRNSISVDQFAAANIGHLTRFPSLALSIGTKSSLSYTQAGVQIPGEDSPSALFRKLFIQGSQAEVDAQVTKIRQGRSILDSVADRSKQLQKRVSKADREKLDSYYNGVRELEERLLAGEEWEKKPKKPVSIKPPQDEDDQGALVERSRAMYDLARLAIDTDSTRLITIFVSQNAIKPNIPGVETGTHPLTHHGNQPDKLAELRLIEEAQLKELANLLDGLASTKSVDGSLLDRTSVLYGTCMGNANAHSNLNLPTLLAGGGFKHGQHLAFDKDKNYPLPNLFVSVLQRLGVEADKFATATGTFTGLEMT